MVSFIEYKTIVFSKCGFLMICIDDATRWLINVLYIYIYDIEMTLENGFMVMIRSTTGPYGRPVIEVAYGEMILSLHRGCMGDESSGRVVGVSA